MISALEVRVGSIFLGGQVLSKNVKSQVNGINISGSTTRGQKVAKRFTPQFLQIVKGCAMPFFTQSGKVCMPLVLLGKSQLNVPSTGLMQTL